MLRRAPDRFEAALRAGSEDPDVRDDLVLARSLSALPLAATPGPDFVAVLGRRLLDSAAELPVPRRHSTPDPLVPSPRRLLVGGRGLRWAAVLVAAVLVGALGVGVLGRSALPGQPLYSVRQLLDRASVATAFAPHTKGVTLLDQAERHVADAIEVASPPWPSGGSGGPGGPVAIAVANGIAAVTDGQAMLVDDFRSTRDSTSLVAVRSFADRVTPRVDTLAGIAPPDVRPAVERLRSLVLEGRLASLQLLAGCAACGPDGEEARQLLGAEGHTATPASTPSASPSVPASATPSSPSPSSKATTSTPAPTASTSQPAATTPATNGAPPSATQSPTASPTSSAGPTPRATGSGGITATVTVPPLVTTTVTVPVPTP